MGRGTVRADLRRISRAPVPVDGVVTSQTGASLLILICAIYADGPDHA
jgi:hypothetical protein